MVFIDGQNLYHCAMEAWGAEKYNWPSYDPVLLAKELTAAEPDRHLEKVFFYTGVPNPKQHAFWHAFWTNKLRALRNSKTPIEVFAGRLSKHGEEKGVDVRLAVDLLRLTFDCAFDLAIVVSQDTDLNEAITACKTILARQGRTGHFESAFTVGPGTQNKRGLAGTAWRLIDKAMYDRCHDPNEYRPPKPSGKSRP